MKILIANSFHYHRGGDCTYTFALSELLESNGHKVVNFAMDHPQNLDSEFSPHFVPEIDYDEIFAHGSLLEQVGTAPKLIYSFEAKKRLARLIENTGPDVIHIQNIHHLLTLSILSTAKKYGIPVVWTLHDYNLICPDINLLHNGEICEACRGGKFYQSVLKKCKRGSIPASLITCLTAYANQKLQKSVNLFISPSAFLKTKLIEHGFAASRIIHVPHFVNLPTVDISQARARQKDPYFVYAGRLSPEKGVSTLVTAIADLKNTELLIAGEGPVKQDLEALTNNQRIKFLGRLEARDVHKLLTNALFTVLPSEWYENSPFSILEAFALGTPVVAARIGGIPELVEDGINGLLFESGNSQDLRGKIDRLLNDPELAATMGKNAQKKAEKMFDKTHHYQQLIEIYEKLGAQNSVSPGRKSPRSTVEKQDEPQQAPGAVR